MNEFLGGKVVSEKIKNDLKEYIDTNSLNITLAILKINHDHVIDSFIKLKEKKCKELNINVKIINIEETKTEEEIINVINELNINQSINGIVIELPIYNHLDKNRILNAISPLKDIDGLTEANMEKLKNNEDCFIPCTVYAIEKFMDYYDIELANKNVTIINTSNLIGKPLLYRLVNKNCNITACNSKTDNLKEICLKSDIIITGTGKAHIINNEYIKDNSVVIDVGCTYLDDKLVGDLDYNSLTDRNIKYTSTPGGIGPITIMCMINNLIKSYKK